MASLSSAARTLQVRHGLEPKVTHDKAAGPTGSFLGTAFSQVRLGTQKVGNFQSSRCKERLGPQIFVVIQNLTELWTSILRRLMEQGRLS